jgi:hypothetical protein
MRSPILGRDKRLISAPHWFCFALGPTCFLSSGNMNVFPGGKAVEAWSWSVSPQNDEVKNALSYTLRSPHMYLWRGIYLRTWTTLHCLIPLVETTCSNNANDGQLSPRDIFVKNTFSLGSFQNGGMRTSSNVDFPQFLCNLRFIGCNTVSDIKTNSTYILKGSDCGVQHTELQGFWTFSISDWDWTQVMLVTIQSRTFCLLVCYLRT